MRQPQFFANHNVIFIQEVSYVYVNPIVIPIQYPHPAHRPRKMWIRDSQRLDRYVGDYDKFQEVYAVKKAQLEAAYKRQQQEIAELEDFVARNKARVSTRNMAMSRQKKLDKMDVIELAKEKPKPEFHFMEARAPGKYLFCLLYTSSCV